MPIYCFVPGCTTTGKNGLHRFPANVELKNEWMKKTQTTHLSPTNNNKVCRKHFKEGDLLVDMDGKKRLVANAVPSLFLPEPSTSQFTWDHSYHSITSPKQRRIKRLKVSKDSNLADVSSANIGNEVELGFEQSDEKCTVGPYITIDYLRSLEQKILQQAQENKTLSRKLQNTSKRLKRLQRQPKNPKLDDKQVLEYLRQKKKFSTAQLEFQEMQMRNAGRKPHGRRYKLKEKSVCLALYKSGPRSYRFKENKLMVLPSLSTLGRHSAKLMFRSGICHELFTFIKNKVQDWPAKDLCCSFGFDETHIKSELQYETVDDEIIGFVELAEMRRPVFATHALTFMVRGINVPFKQPVAHFYTHGLKSHELVELIVLVLRAVIWTGLNVLMSVSDQVQINESAVHMLMDRDFQRHPGCLLQYKIDDKTIVHCYDGPHIIKVVRNNLEMKDIKHHIKERWSISNSNCVGNEQIASWDDVRHLFDIDRQGCHRLLPKITEEHMKPTKLKMKVSVATQVFSQTYGSAMLRCADKKQIPAKSLGTGQLLLFLNDFFDSINGGGPAQEGTLKGSITKDSIHFLFWEYALKVLSKMNFIDKSTGKVNSRSTVLSKMESTIKGYQEITKICLNESIELVSLRNTDSDGLENFFGCVKSVNQVACAMTPRQFRSGYTAIILNNLTSSKSRSTNCEQDDSSALLTDIHDLIVQRMANIETDMTHHHTDAPFQDIITFDPQFTKTELNFFERESLSKNSNLICSKVVARSFCENCRRTLLCSGTITTESDLKYPSPIFIALFQKVYRIAVQVVPFFSEEKLLKKILVVEVKKKLIEEDDGKGVGCADHNEEIVNTIVECTVVYAITVFCKNVNNFLYGKVRELPVDANSIEELAHEFWKKKKRIGKHSDVFSV